MMIRSIYTLLAIFSMTSMTFLWSQSNQASSTEANWEEQIQQTSQVQYVNDHEIFPGQTRYSSRSVVKKVAKLIDKGSVTWQEDQKQWKYTYNQETSVFSEKEALPVVHAPFGYVLIDGHHDMLASLQLKAETVPIKIVGDLSHLEIDQFWSEAEKRGWAYLHAMGGEKVLPCTSFDDLIDDPNRSFATFISHIYYPDPSGSYTSRGAEYPVWIKVGKDLPFIEFKIADALFAHGFVYQPELMGTPPAQEFVEQARQILLEANIPGLRVVSNRVHYKQILTHCESLDVSAKY